MFKVAEIPAGKITLRRHAKAVGNGRFSSHDEANFFITTGNDKILASGQHLVEAATRGFASLIQAGGFAFPMNAIRNEPPFEKGMTFVYSVEDLMLEVWEGEITVSVATGNVPLFTVSVDHPDAKVTATEPTIEAALLGARRKLLGASDFRVGKLGAEVMANRRATSRLSSVPLPGSQL